ncbi:MAG TPA: hypothetical protein VF591_15730 [Pyrinomonadaceae bacterium]
MLSEEDRARIKAEEIYRQEVRDDLGRGKGKQSGVWEFVNSSIFLWFLSTVAVGGITYAWTVHQNRVADERAAEQKRAEVISARRELIGRLDLEIEGRLSQFLVDVEHMVAKPYDARYSLAKPFTLEHIRRQWNVMKMPPRYSQASAVYPEFAERGIVSLIIELDKLEQEARKEKGKTDAENAGAADGRGDITADRRLRRVAVDIQDDVIFDGKDKPEFLPVYSEFKERIMKWESMFPYMDCNVTAPFC